MAKLLLLFILFGGSLVACRQDDPPAPTVAADATEIIDDGTPEPEETGGEETPGASAPSATINGSSLSVDLSSLFFGWSRGSEVRAWNIGGLAQGLFNPETNIKYGLKYLAKARQLGGGSTCGTILRYNAGHGATRMNPVSAAYCAKVKRQLAG